jgi:hypothetical protein
MTTYYSEGFYITIGGLVFGFLGLMIRYCLKSKCNRVECLCFKVHRNIEVEEEIAQMEIQNGVYNKTSSDKITL